MADTKLHASPDFFKQLSLEFQHLDLIFQALETYAFRASVRSHELGDHRLTLILEQLEIFISRIQELRENLENLLCRVVIVA